MMHPNSWKVVFLDRELWVDSYFLSVPSKIYYIVWSPIVAVKNTAAILIDIISLHF